LTAIVPAHKHPGGPRHQTQPPVLKPLDLSPVDTSLVTLFTEHRERRSRRWREQA